MTSISCPASKDRIELDIQEVAEAPLKIPADGIYQIDVVFNGPPGDDVVTVAVASGTGDVVAMTYRGKNFAGAPGEVRQVYSDFREVGGLRLPYRTDAAFEGDPYIVVTAT